VAEIDHVCKTILSRAADLLRLQAFIDPATLPSDVFAAMNELRLPDRPVKINSRPAVTGEVNEVLAALDEKEREALVQFYGQEQPSTQICREVGLTEESLSALRSRVKAAISMGHKKGKTVLGVIPNLGSGQV
jgi:DNA-directed RNA polymerase specialized sigma24 family protein